MRLRQKSAPKRNLSVLRAELDLSPVNIFASLCGASRAAIAVSGGSDSMAMLHLAFEWAKAVQNPPQFVVLTVDHNLRAASATEALQVGAWCAEFGLQHEILNWQHQMPTTGIQAKARQARYDLMTAWCAGHGVPVLMTGHTADDQAETVLMRSSRTSTAASLAGIWPERDWNAVRVIRPLLNLRRGELRNYLKKRGLDWIDDPSNHDTRFERVRVRKDLNGKLGSLVFQAQSAYVEILRDRELAQVWCDQNLNIHELGFVRFSRPGFQKLSAGVQDLIIQRLLNICGMQNSVVLGKRTNLLNWLIQEAGTRRSLGGAVFSKRRFEVVVGRETGRNPPPPILIPASGEVIWDGRFRVSGPVGAIVTPRPVQPRQKDIPAFVQAGLPVVVVDGLIVIQGVKYEFLRH